MPHGEMSEDVGQAADMVELGVCGNDIIDGPNSAVPEIRCDDSAAHVEPLITGATVDQDNLTARQLEYRTVALRDIEERNAEPVVIEQESRRPQPPAEQQDETHTRDPGRTPMP